MMRRRELIALLGGVAAWPLGARAQQPATPVIGFLGSGSPETSATRVQAFRKGLGERGFAEDQNVAIEYRWAEDQYDRLPSLAADLIRRHAAVIVAAGALPAAQAAKASTIIIPVVFLTGVDPVQAGLIASLSRPGGNLTGITTLGTELAPKRLEVIHETIPSATSIGLLANPTNPITETLVRDVQAAAQTRGVLIHIVYASAERDFDAAFARLFELGAQALVIGGDQLFNSRSERLAALAIRHSMPAIYQYREFVAGGGLMSYGGSLADAYRQVGIYAGRILKGEMAADLPVHQSTKVELIVNLKTAKALGLEIPPVLLARADEVIE